MAEVETPRRGRWWRRIPGRLDKVGSGLGQQLRSRISLGRGAGEELYEEIFELLLAADCGVRIAEELVSGLRERASRQKLREGEELLAALREEMAARLAGPDRELSLAGEPAIWLVAGVNGSGKTTTVAKLAARLQGQGLTPLIAAGDTFRAAAIEQLRTLAARSGTELVAHQLGSDPAAVVFDALVAAQARGRDVVLVDTAGRLHTQHNLMQELSKIRRVIGAQQPGQPVETLLVLDAHVGANALAQARAFVSAVGATGLVLTKLDGSARGGYVFQVESELSVPVKLVGVGEGLDDLADFSPSAFLDALLEEGGASGREGEG
ncbi:MAG TPA: signal recognition particle-docking protein FtsY [Candidatus Micrarchaeaceae archaeon]|nr:signal recognition particle-docking protein FtsY [Candidatus Micrarchaeaceae archaeon]